MFNNKILFCSASRMEKRDIILITIGIVTIPVGLLIAWVNQDKLESTIFLLGSLIFLIGVIFVAGSFLRKYFPKY